MGNCKKIKNSINSKSVILVPLKTDSYLIWRKTMCFKVRNNYFNLGGFSELKKKKSVILQSYKQAVSPIVWTVVNTNDQLMVWQFS